ncbi:MAG: DUF72 domain-containing protein, partial [Actinobacteria bacterium]|nr:DUF72 domain-containing protein [Actinomycetota bacterium]
MIHIGTSGWQYDSWKGRFYPKDLPKSEWLRFFSTRFETVEVNNTFYRMPKEDSFVRWRRESASDFCITIKASRYITHLKRLKECGPSVELLWSRCRQLGGKLGPVLFQLPPRFPADPPRLEAFCELLPTEMRAAFEFRDLSWERDDVYAILERFGAAFVYADRPGARVPRVVTSGWAYIRFHQGMRARPDYTRTKLARWADRIVSLDARETWI